MTEAMPFLQKTILLSYDPRPFAGGFLFHQETNALKIQKTHQFVLAKKHVKNNSSAFQHD